MQSGSILVRDKVAGAVFSISGSPGPFVHIPISSQEELKTVRPRGERARRSEVAQLNKEQRPNNSSCLDSVVVVRTAVYRSAMNQVGKFSPQILELNIFLPVVQCHSVPLTYLITPSRPLL